jgi:hypothetical protein
MVATIPGLGELVEKADRGEPVPEHVRRQGLGTPDDVAPLVVYLASAESSGVTGQAIAVGGDRIALWTHPALVDEQLRPGGWTPEAVRDLFATELKGELQVHGHVLGSDPGQVRLHAELLLGLLDVDRRRPGPDVDPRHLRERASEHPVHLFEQVIEPAEPGERIPTARPETATSRRKRHRRLLSCDGNPLRSLTDRAKADLMGHAEFLKNAYVSRGELHPDAAVFLDAALR